MPTAVALRRTGRHGRSAAVALALVVAGCAGATSSSPAPGTSAPAGDPGSQETPTSDVPPSGGDGSATDEVCHPETTTGGPVEGETVTGDDDASAAASGFEAPPRDGGDGQCPD